jgi:hypothetical protein
MLPYASLDVVLNKEFSLNISESITSYGFIDFDQLTDFEWNYMLIVTPYQDPWELLENNGMRRQRINTGIKYGDGHNLLMFFNDTRIAGYINLPRNVADFFNYSYEQCNWLLRRENSTFVAVRPESMWQAWHGVHLAHWENDDYFPLRNRHLTEIANAIRNDDEQHFVFVEPLTAPEAIARHELSRELFPFAPSSSLLEVAVYDEGTLPEYVVVEIVTLSLHKAANPPKFPEESVGNQNYASGDLLGFYTGLIQYVQSSSEYIGEGWWAVVSRWQGKLHLMN